MDFAADQSLMLPESDALREAFTAHLVLPDVLSKLPNAKLFISYSDHVSIELGNLVMPEYVSYKFHSNRFGVNINEVKVVTK